jgi:beta-lysine 5,6-aminomutase beta subunit
MKFIRPYGDTKNDGAVQLSFTLPVENGQRAREAARILLAKMGFEDIEIVHSQDLGEGYTYFVTYGKTIHDIDIDSIKVAEIEIENWTLEEVDEYIRKTLNRPIVVVGATIGTDAHTVGLDAILNMKGYHGVPGLERYKMFEVYNMGAQVSPQDLVLKIKEVKADVVLISQIVTQKGIHIKNLKSFIELAQAQEIRDKVLLIVGGPRITNQMVVELGFDIGFSKGSLPNQVATYIAKSMAKKFGVD